MPRIKSMRRTWKRLKIVSAVLAIGAMAAESAELERKAHLACYYRELGSRQAQLSAFERVMFTVLLATTDHLGKHKRQA